MNKYPTYLIHFNKNHDPKNGQFAEGDGDGDGIVDDHGYAKRNRKAHYRMENREGKWHTWGRAEEGESQGYHRGKTFLDDPYYVDSKGFKHKYRGIWELPNAREAGKAYVNNLGKVLVLPISYIYSTADAFKSIADMKYYPKEDKKKE